MNRKNKIKITIGRTQGLSGRDIYSSSATFKVLKLSSFFLHDQKEPKNLGFVKFLSRILDIFTSVKNIPWSRSLPMRSELASLHVLITPLLIYDALNWF